MNIHKNARLTSKGREILVRRMLEEGLRVAEAAQASGVSVRTAYKWRARSHRVNTKFSSGESGWVNSSQLLERSSST